MLGFLPDTFGVISLASALVLKHGAQLDEADRRLVEVLLTGLLAAFLSSIVPLSLWQLSNEAGLQPRAPLKRRLRQIHTPYEQARQTIFFNKYAGPSAFYWHGFWSRKRKRRAVWVYLKDCIKRPEIALTINKVLGFSKYTGLNKASTKLPAKKTNPNNPKRSLCEELELILRCKQLSQPNLDHSKSFFFTYDEMLVNKVN